MCAALPRSVHSVEALLSALECCGIDNARIEVEGGDELPVVDGSAMGWAINIVVAGQQPAHGSGRSAAGQHVKRRALKPHQVPPRAPVSSRAFKLLPSVVLIRSLQSICNSQFLQPFFTGFLKTDVRRRWLFVLWIGNT